MSSAVLLQQIRKELNNHSSGSKHVFISNKDTETALTQFAYGIMEPGEESGLHSHKTMDEYFYFTKGRGVYLVNDECMEIVQGTFVNISNGIAHNLINNSDTLLEFVYFGIATDYSSK